MPSSLFFSLALINENAKLITNYEPFRLPNRRQTTASRISNTHCGKGSRGSLFCMLILKHGSTVEPPEDASLRLGELVAAINAAAKLLTPADACAIWHELNTVARTLKRVDYRRPPHQPANAATTATPTQSDLLG